MEQNDLAIKRMMQRKRRDRLMKGIFLSATAFGIIMLTILIINILTKAWGWVDWQFITSLDSSRPKEAGIIAALVGSLWIMLFTAPIAFILGVATAIYLEEYAKQSWLTRLIQTNISNLAGVPSIVFGMMGFSLFVFTLGLGRSILAGALTMALLILPIVVVASQEAIRSVPQSLRQASYAMGATKWQTMRRIVLPSAFPGVLTGIILALSRAIGETAPLLMIGAATFVYFLPEGPLDRFTALPIQIYSWVTQPKAEFANVAAAGIVVLLVILLGMNSIAVYLRNRLQKRG
ncbi:phosphate ABC transporter permease PstA [Rubeoparvulum massiliense]|uniref:phosphate ABC transporter permease PstA n=1 Tax=Rubeoparvulum massiliense TaxID=1631346 RepID=UPI00065E64ED|nr:phosphate ABC transporter permease PstA [Rubeoparvulum massiliense]